MIAAAVFLWATGLPDRWGFVGASQGLGLGAAVSAPLWLLSLFRRARSEPGDAADSDDARP
ncbi:hypothetical protein IHQ68_10815 [Chelatococcus sambhunathii]|uniref:Uncharacterized protein n=1 Tax=Chelatococcus sambhunathii TaxID=363953 RepID=A0ABU1DG84_9HYPH|nr:hypothetical protein [Chelatococcus sambhunathii]MDR4307111.1 hypothetical protein [Chelatococcus sambhunathii]